MRTRKNKVMARMHNGWLIKRGDQVVLHQLLNGFGTDRAQLRFVHGVQVTYKGLTYKATTKTYLKHGIPWQTEGYEEQYILPLKHWELVTSRTF